MLTPGEEVLTTTRATARDGRCALILFTCGLGVLGEAGIIGLVSDP
jgi:hypothetical protein